MEHGSIGKKSELIQGKIWLKLKNIMLRESHTYKWHAVCFHLYEILLSAKLTLVRKESWLPLVGGAGSEAALYLEGAWWNFRWWLILEWVELRRHQFSSAQSCPTFCYPMDCSMPGLPVHYQLPKFTQTHAHWVSDVIQPSHPLSSPSPPAFNLSQHQGLFKWVSSSHQVAKVLEFHLQHQCFQWIFRTDFL